MNRRDQATLTGAPARVQNVATEQTVITGACRLARLLVANANAAVQTVTIKDGAATLIVLQIPAHDSRSFELAIPITTSLKVTPSHADIDALFSIAS